MLFVVKEENECRECAAPAYPCMGDSCKFRHVKHYYGDECGSDEDTLYILDDEELCIECVKFYIVRRAPGFTRLQ